MRKVFILGVLLLPLLALAQTGSEKYRDSLQQILESIRDLEKEQQGAEVRKQKIDVLCLLSQAYDGIDPTKTFDLAFEALEANKKTITQREWQIPILRWAGHSCILIHSKP